MMPKRLALLMQSVMYALRGGFLVRPLVIAIVPGTLGAVLSWIEEALPESGHGFPKFCFPRVRILKLRKRSSPRLPLRL